MFAKVQSTAADRIGGQHPTRKRFNQGLRLDIALLTPRWFLLAVFFPRSRSHRGPPYVVILMPGGYEFALSKIRPNGTRA